MSWRSLTTSEGLDTGANGFSFRNFPDFKHRDGWGTRQADPDKSLVSRLGILAVDITDQIRSAIGTVRLPGGVVVVGRAANLIVSDSGVQTGDIIHSLNNKAIDSVGTLRREVRALKSGDAVVLQIERDGGLQYLPFEME